MNHSEDNKSRFSKILPWKGKPAQGPLAEQGPSSAITGKHTSHAPTNISMPPSRLCCLIEGERIVFEVPVPADDRNVSVSNLKELIYNQRSLDTLRDVGKHTLELWKVCAS